MNSLWNWLKDPGTQAILVLVGVALTAISAIAAGIAAYFSWKAPSKEDLQRVEKNTAHLQDVRASIANVDDRTRRQEEADSLAGRANFVSIIVRGEGDADKPLSVSLTGTEPNIRFTRVEFRSEIGNVFRTSECIPTCNLFEFIARLPSDHLKTWRGAGTPLATATTRHILRVWMRFDEQPHEVHRDMAVILTSRLRGGGKDAPGINVSTFKIEGAV